MNLATPARAMLLVSACVLATACGSGSSGGGDIEPDTPPLPQPPVEPQSPEQSVVSEQVVVPVGPELPPVGSDGLLSLAPGDVITGSLLDGQESIIRVPSGAEVILTSDTGDVEMVSCTHQFLHGKILLLRCPQQTIARCLR